MKMWQGNNRGGGEGRGGLRDDQELRRRMERVDTEELRRQ